MDFLNIDLSGLALTSNIQVGDELFMDEVIGKTSSIKSVREAVQEYCTELPLSIDVLERSLRRNLDVVACTSTDEPSVITEDENDEEEI